MDKNEKGKSHHKKNVLMLRCGFCHNDLDQCSYCDKTFRQGDAGLCNIIAHFCSPECLAASAAQPFIANLEET
jgi:hypothetical protein